MKIPFLVGRILFGGFFLYNGINHFRQRKPLAQYAGGKKVPAPEAAVIGSGTLITVGGASIVTGIFPEYGAAAIIAFLAGVSPVMHNFWSVDDPNQSMNDMVHFSKNLALLGAALAFAGVEEPWPMSLSIPERKQFDKVWKVVRRRLAA